MSHNISSENRIFKLSTGEEVKPEVIEGLIETTCHYVKYAVVSQNESNNPVAFIFPNKKLYTHPEYMLTPNEGCFCPRNLDELGRCLTGCMKLINSKIDDKEDKIVEAILLNSGISSEVEPRISYEEVIEKYKTLLYQAHGEKVPVDEEIYYIKNI